MSPQIHGRHSLVSPDGAQDDELAEALLETQREISRPIPMHVPPEGFLDRIIKRTLQVLEAVLAFILMRALWSRKALAAGLAGSTAIIGFGLFTADSGGAQLPPVERHQADTAELLGQLANIDNPVRVESPPPLFGMMRSSGADYVAPTLNELTRPATRNEVSREGLYWAADNIDRLIERAMRKNGMSLDEKSLAVGSGWRCHETSDLHGGMLAYKHYFDQATGRTKTKAVRCFRL
jgi:hypothetical protein